MVLFSQPPSGTLIANFEGARNATTLFCNISGNGMTQIGTTWSIQNYRGSTGLVDITGSPEPFVVSGGPNPLAPEFSLLNELTVSNWTADLDGTIIFCGTGTDQREASFLLRVYRKSSLVPRPCMRLRKSLLFLLLSHCTIVIKRGVYLSMATMANYHGQPKDCSPIDLGLVAEDN